MERSLKGREAHAMVGDNSFVLSITRKAVGIDGP